jgi:hypothetical protein
MRRCLNAILAYYGTFEADLALARLLDTIATHTFYI